MISLELLSYMEAAGEVDHLAQDVLSHGPAQKALRCGDSDGAGHYVRSQEVIGAVEGYLYPVQAWRPLWQISRESPREEYVRLQKEFVNARSEGSGFFQFPLSPQAALPVHEVAGIQDMQAG
ncbi:MAG: hypothetical protein C1O27_000029 [Chloroflexi bacterium]|jgi:hypothetical protein|nr:MAG: hypothetical protein C1O27_000029 [Chloroflexota bacterium]